jgi:YihY family inner membrane protein
MNAVWNVPYVRRPNFILRQLRALGVLALLALSTIGSTVLTGFATLAVGGWGATAILLVGSTALNFVLILAAFKVMIAAPVRLREVVLGAALAAIFWQTLQAIGSWYVGRELSHNSNTYGFFGVVIVLLSWIYLGAQLFLLAAEINVVQHFRLWPRSIVQPPLTAADKAVFERLAQMAIRRPEAELSVAFTSEADRDPLRPDQ